MNKSPFVKDYLTFTKKERMAVFVILALLFFIFLLPHFFSRGAKTVAIVEDTSLKNAIGTLQQKSQGHVPDEGINHFPVEPTLPSQDITGTEFFTFDPNTLSPEGWKRLGLHDKVIKTIHNYRSKGGKFYKPEDLQKIWGLPRGFYERAASYIQITSVPADHLNKPDEANTTFKKPGKRIAVVEINSADTSAFIALPGIGSKLATRIVSFRDKLGGFSSVNQIAETYGLPDSTFQKLKPYFQINANTIKKFNINMVTKDELRAHPYIRWHLANAIVEYRNQHGPYKNISELKNIMLIDEATFNKITPYLSL